MIDFLLKIFQPMIDFIYNHFVQLAWMCIVLYGIKILKKSSSGRQWLENQLEWVKSFFYDEDDHPEKPSSKNLVIFALLVLFIVSYLKIMIYAASTSQMPDIPQMWAIVLLAGLGINQVKSTAQKFFENKFNSINHVTEDDSEKKKIS